VGDIAGNGANSITIRDVYRGPFPRIRKQLLDVFLAGE